MATTQLSGLVSGFDWKTFIDSTIEYASAPITAMEKEQATNLTKGNSLTALDTKMTALQTAVAALQTNTVFTARTASLSSAPSSWSISAASGATPGSYTVDVSQFATASKLKGTSDIANGLATSSDVSGLTISTLPLGTAIKAGSFTINGQQISVALSDSLQDVFDKISTATGGNVTASYDATTDKISLNATSGNVLLGAANDSSNFLTALRLANNGTASVSSTSALGTLPTSSPLANAGLRTAITAVDGSGNGSFSLNGVSIAYNVNTDSLQAVMARINASAANVSATYDSASDRVVLTNKTTGDTGIFIDEAAGGLLGSLGLTGGSLERGDNAIFSINGGPDLISLSNTLSEDVHGITGLSITANSVGSGTATIASDTSSMQTKIVAFIAAFNDVQSYIDDQTKITSVNGKVTTSTLSDNREVQAWSQTLRRNAFAAVDGLSGTISRLEDMGIDFTSGTSQLSIKSQTKLTAALTSKPEDVAAFFSTGTTGFAARLKSSVDLIAGTEFGKGYIDEQQTKLTTNTSSLDQQIAAVQRQLDQQRELLTASFIAMETAQQSYTNMQTQLTKAFSSTSSSS